MNPFDLTGKKAIVTGAASGLSHGIAEGLMEAGAEVVIIDISANTEAAAIEFCSRGFKAHGVRANLGDRTELVRAFNEALKKLGGKIDILVPAAGIQRRNKSEEFTLEDWDAVLNINLSAVFLLCQLAGREMLKQKSGKIINIASMLSFFGGYTVPAYAASKGGVSQLTKALSNEWAREGINVNAIAPGYMATSMNTKILEDEARNAEITNRIPARRWGTPEDLKGVTVFLASHASDYLSGAVIPVDGGYLGC
ncbi:SDR family oxidoreductase [Hydrogenoanaerobacterium sp.]|uniref:SDR family oxidoreductase n=1 Tax=Hydrogenoanaerobacterium sp. TaxID=2953763 RepID=UPI00289A8083|nr:SDR family oxidoreductase [Hydrogenoanaerobacterium sp.]